MKNFFCAVAHHCYTEIKFEEMFSTLGQMLALNTTILYPPQEY